MKKFASRVFGTTWEVDDDGSAVCRDKNDKVKRIAKQKKIKPKAVSFDVRTPINPALFDQRVKDQAGEKYEVNSQEILSCPRGYVVSGVWCPTIETAKAVSDDNGGAVISTYDEAV
jgi:hypothetical protein